MAASLTTTDSRTARLITMSGAALCAPAVRNPSQAAASQPWERSSTQSTLCALSASSSLTRAPSKSRTKSPTATAASSNSSVRLGVYCFCVSAHLGASLSFYRMFSSHHESIKCLFLAVICLLAMTLKGLLWMSKLLHFTKDILKEPKEIFLFRLFFLCATGTRKQVATCSLYVCT